MTAQASFANPLLMSKWIEDFILSSQEECDRVTFNSQIRQAIQSNCHLLAKMAYEQNMPTAKATLHKCLATIYAYDFSLTATAHSFPDVQPVIKDVSSILERAMLENEYALLDKQQIENCPTSGVTYLKWLKTMIAKHPANAHPFYREFLRDYASASDIRFYLAQETNLDPRFDDILALLQVGTHGQAKMEIANNYWDEMGNGLSENVHTALFSKALASLEIDEAYVANNMLDESRISGNLSAALALSRRHYYKAIGYFGVTEYIAPSRFKHLIAAWERNGLPEEGMAYHKLHVTIDAVHGNAWFNRVIAPAIDSNPALGREIALGAMMRLNSSARYLGTMLNHLMLSRLQNPKPFASHDTGNPAARQA